MKRENVLFDTIKCNRILPVRKYEFFTEFTLTRPDNMKMDRRKLPWHPWLLCLILCMSIGMATGCPMRQGCSCEVNDGKSIINCRYAGLQQVPVIEPSQEQYYELTLAHNSIQTLGANAFQGLNVEVLDLSENPIATISDNAFEGLEVNLKELILHVNSMSSFPSTALNHLVNLQRVTFKGFSLNSLPSNSFSGLSRLESLTMKECRLSVLSAAVVTPIKDSLVTLNLQSNNFRSLPDALSELTKLRKLQLAQNQITSLNAGLFAANTNLEELDISANGLITINAAAFQGIESSLKKLHLHNNRMTHSQLAPLNQLVALTVLDLSYNKGITSLPNSVFSQLVQLGDLKLTGNGIQALSGRSFEGLSNLIYLDLAENDIQSIDTTAFTHLRSLESLELDHQPNLFSALQPTTFSPLAATLQNLSMEATGFHSGKWSTITVLTNLRNLDISNNDLRSLPDLGLTKFTSLESIGLSGNNLAEITQVKMHGPQSSLKRVTLNNNLIRSIDLCVFEEFNLEQVSLSSNPLRCDCHLKWLRQWVADNYQGPNLYLIDWECKEPDQYKDKKVRDLQVNDFVCDPPEDDPVCQPVTPPSTTKKSTLPSTTTTAVTVPQPTGTPLLVNVSKITHNSCMLHWRLQSGIEIQGFTVEYSKFKEYVNSEESFDLGPEARSAAVENLTPDTLYIMCVQMKSPQAQQACVDVKTSPSPTAGEVKGSATGAIVGGIIGGIVFIALVAVLVFLLWRRKKTKAKGAPGGLFHTKASGTLPSAATRPAMGYNSKRFSRDRTLSTDVQNATNKDFESKMAHLSRDEQDRILNFLTNSAGSTLSMISSGSSQRYVPDLPPRPAHLEGYLNPVSVKSDESSDSLDEHVYSEIGNNYSEIGLTTHYDNNNLRKNEPVPPIPEDSYI